MVLLGSEYKKLQQGHTAPDFTLPATDGNTYTLPEIKGSKATLIIFMCNHCPYVLPKIKEIKRIAEDFQKQGLAVIGINSNEDENYPEDSFDKMRKYFDKWQIPFHYLRDESQEIAQDYGAVCTPDPFLFDENLKLVYHGRIDDSHGKEEGEHELYAIIKMLLETSEVVAEEQQSMGCSIKWK